MIFSCESENALYNNEFTVIVEDTADLACGLPVIRFLDKTSPVRKKTSLETLTYSAYELDDSLNIVGTKLIVEFTEVSPENSRVCNTLGVSYPGITIVNARLAN